MKILWETVGLAIGSDIDPVVFARWEWDALVHPGVEPVNLKLTGEVVEARHAFLQLRSNEGFHNFYTPLQEVNTPTDVPVNRNAAS